MIVGTYFRNDMNSQEWYHIPGGQRQTDHCEFKDSQDYIGRPCLNTWKKKKRKERYRHAFYNSGW